MRSPRWPVPAVMVNMPAKLFAFALPLAFLVVVAGAFTRLSDAGLGCPDWPGCYGKLTGVPSEAEAAAHSPEAPFELRKAWIELAHRAIAGILALTLFAAALVAWRTKQGRLPAYTLALLVVLQALLGMLTVTEQLRPAYVLAHLLGGMLILFVLAFSAALRPLPTGAPKAPGKSAARLRVWGTAAALVLFAQMGLGSWVSANYAGLACPDFPTCQSSFAPAVIDFSGFLPHRKLHLSADGNPLSAAALATIHWLHRLGAAAAALVVGGFALVMVRSGARRAGATLLLLLIVQIFIGVAAVAAQLPIELSLAHNIGAALLTVAIAAVLAKIRGMKTN